MIRAMALIWKKAKAYSPVELLARAIGRKPATVTSVPESMGPAVLVKAKEADVLLAFDQNEAVRNLHFLKQGGHAIINTHEPAFIENPSLRKWMSDRGVKVHTVMGYDILKREMGGRFLFLNVLILGALCGAGVGNVTIEEVREAVKALAPSKFVDDNLKAVDLGYAGTHR